MWLLSSKKSSNLVVVVVIGRPPEGGKVGIPALKAWNLASRPIHTTSYFPRRGQVLTPRLPGIEPGPFGLEVQQPRGPQQIRIGSAPGGVWVSHRPLGGIRLIHSIVPTLCKPFRAFTLGMGL